MRNYLLTGSNAWYKQGAQQRTDDDGVNEAIFLLVLLFTIYIYMSIDQT